MEKQTVLVLLVQLQNLEHLKMKLLSELSKHLFQKEIRLIIEDFSLDSDGERLADAVSQRDFPLTRAEVETIFQESGFDFTSKDIDNACPDRDDTTLEYRQEELSQYCSVYGAPNENL